MRGLAAHMRVPVKTPEMIPGLTPEDLKQINGPLGFSAVCIKTPQSHLIIHNSSHGVPRQESDIAHELSHIICKHQPDKIVQVGGGGGLRLRTFNPEQEEEAIYLGGCLQLPRAALINCLFGRKTRDMIAETFHASPHMVNFRINLTGAERVVSRARSKWKSSQRFGMEQ